MNKYLGVFLLTGIIASGFSFRAKEAGPVLPAVQVPVFKKDTFNIVKYGAKGDGVTLNTFAINSAIAACSAFNTFSWSCG